MNGDHRWESLIYGLIVCVVERRIGAVQKAAEQLGVVGLRRVDLRIVELIERDELWLIRTAIGQVDD